MSWRPTNPLALWEDPAYTRQIQDLGGAKRLDEQLMGVTYTIASDPESCTHVFDNVWVVTTRDYPEAPSYFIAFTINEDGHGCTLRWIEPI